MTCRNWKDAPVNRKIAFKLFAKFYFSSNSSSPLPTPHHAVTLRGSLVFPLSERGSGLRYLHSIPLPGFLPINLAWSPASIGHRPTHRPAGIPLADSIDHPPPTSCTHMHKECRTTLPENSQGGVWWVKWRDMTSVDGMAKQAVSSASSKMEMDLSFPSPSLSLCSPILDPHNAPKVFFLHLWHFLEAYQS